MLSVTYAGLGWRREALEAQAEARRLGGGRKEVDALLAEIDEHLDDDDDKGRAALLRLLIAALVARRLRRG